ncbi:hypothetical protein V6N12_010217 [Hibiscus sabdariffa]|uniref:Uncharacterized protein n=1 Tax=Hibiscus sabdariffa TaxID=183260 RepID=A0ABR2ATS9_9ROSI
MAGYAKQSSRDATLAQSSHIVSLNPRKSTAQLPSGATFQCNEKDCFCSIFLLLFSAKPKASFPWKKKRVISVSHRGTGGVHFLLNGFTAHLKDPMSRPCYVMLQIMVSWWLELDLSVMVVIDLCSMHQVHTMNKWVEGGHRLFGDIKELLEATNLTSAQVAEELVKTEE